MNVRCEKICNIANQKSYKKPNFLMLSTNLSFKSFSRIFLTIDERLTEEYVLAIALSPIFLTTGNKDDTFQQSGKLNLFKKAHCSLR